jgi:hypothetical protein
LRAILIAVSTASAPVFIGSAISVSLTAHSFSKNEPIRSLCTARDVRVNRPACASSAATIRG